MTYPYPEDRSVQETAFVAMPSHRSRLLERGHLHTRAIALRLAENSSMGVLDEVLVRASLTHSQSGLTRDERVNNMEGAFRVDGHEDGYIEGFREGIELVLVDDLMTTGATLDAAAGMLEQCGARVTLVVAALRREMFGGAPKPD